MPYDITLEMVDYVDGDCVQTLVLRKDLYEDHHATALANSYERLLDSFVTDPTTSLDQPDLSPPEEIDRVMSLGQGEIWTRKWPETLVHRVDVIARSRADQVAVVHGNEVNTYADIHAHANAIADSLLQAGIPAQSPVAVLMERSSAWVSSMLGILRAGAVYVPLDLSLPLPRLRAIATSCQPGAVLVDTESKQKFVALGLRGVEMINVSALNRQVPDITILAGADGPAAILYTSGSSGTPKGIVLKHEGMLNWFEPIQSLYDLQAGREVILQQTSPSFDMSLTQVFTALCLGGMLCITSKEQRGDAEAICKIIQEQKVSYTCATPSEYGSWLRYGGPSLQCAKSWKTALCAGEHLSQTLVEQFSALGNQELKLFNLYGPTEISITCTATPVPLNTPRLPVTAGRPLPNYSVYVLDGQLRPVARGVQGEVYVGGTGVALGYLNNAELTSTRFVANPFASPRSQERGWTKLHRTGDLGRWQHDGTLVIEGRIDTQVKLRGLRIDLAEIEEALTRYSEGRILDAVVSMQRSNPDKPEHLIAHAVFASPDEASQQARDITAKLRSVLPHYMCPATIIHIERIPTTTSGKLDRRFISSLELPFAAERDQENRTNDTMTEDDTQSRLRRVWEQVLDSNVRITTETDFFHVGGSSLLLLDLQKRIKDTFGTTMSLIRMFELSTFGSMAQQIQHGLHHQLDSEPIDWDAEIALSPPLLECNGAPNGVSKLSASEPRVVVITGVTGRLGRALADRLASDPRVERIHCIGVRDTQMNTNSKLWGLDANKVVLHQGNLSLPNLGLSDDAAAQVFSEADLIIHAGADKSYLKSYRSLRAANLQSTKDIAELCIRYGREKYVPIHYISTLAVRNMASAVMRSLAELNGEGDRETLVGSLSRFQPPHLPQNVGMAQTAYGYTASKWASESFLEKIHQAHPDWSIVIHRPGAMARDRDVSVNAPSSELVESLRYYSSIIHALPAVPIFGDHVKIGKAFGLVPVSEVASKVFNEAVEAMESIDASSPGRREHLKFVHHAGTTEDPTDNFNLLGDGEAAGVIQQLPLNEWIKRAYEVGMQPTMGLLLEDLVVAETHWASTG
ncbi:putative NRPS-like protein biosynthetic cluster [Diaporthe australafricana]|uniref:NRPS-like protein biosynthetic cluster n=1 Tax=Diaporthe australafricana TaxID=127596 RepID=A0ABR3Y437_9PEZI